MWYQCARMATRAEVAPAPRSSDALGRLTLTVSVATTALSRAFLIAVLLFALAAPAGALAGIARSPNWGGYAIHGQGVAFRHVVGRWRQPRVSCVPGAVSYSAFWVGLGGFNANSAALEQAGTEVDCGLTGNPTSYAWYEIVPHRPVTLTRKLLTVLPGDAVSASVTVDRRGVTLSLYNRTRHQGFRKVLQARTIDVSSAEWIVEAPSGCNLAGTICLTLPLADFHSATFRSAQAQTNGGHRGSISDPSWRSTKINLVAGPPTPGATARPSPLASDGSSFQVTYSERSVSAPRARLATTIGRGHHAPRVPGRR